MFFSPADHGSPFDVSTVAGQCKLEGGKGRAVVNRTRGRHRTTIVGGPETTHHSGVALQAVLAVLAGAVLADLAVGDGSVALGGALAPIVDGGVHEEAAALAGERLGASPLELTDARGCQLRRTGRNA